MTWRRHSCLPRPLENRGADTRVCRVETRLDAFTVVSGSAIPYTIFMLCFALRTHMPLSTPFRDVHQTGM